VDDGDRAQTIKDRREGDDALAALSPEVERALIANHERFLRFLEARVGSATAAEEILQSALVRALEKGDHVVGEEGAVTWFYRVLRNAIVDHQRHLAAESRALAEVEKTAPSNMEPELKGAVCDCVAELIPTLKPEYASIVKAVDLEGRSPTDVARELGITANSATVRLHRARQALRRQIERSCGACATHSCLDCSCRHRGAELVYEPTR
jgi:RNA polymerase sigma-70 factor (ECF subfamily)